MVNLRKTKKRRCCNLRKSWQMQAKLQNFRQAEADFTAAINVDKHCQAAYFNRGEVRCWT